MAKEITIPVHLHEMKEEDILSANERRDKYSLKRDLQVQEFNNAIAARLAKIEKEE